MFCPKCGAGINEESVFCEKCGHKLSKEENGKKADGKKRGALFTGHLLNLFSILPLLLLFIGLPGGGSSGSESGGSSGGGVTLKFDASNILSSTRIHLLLALGIWAVAFILGIVIYKTRAPRLGERLSYIYLIGACISLIIMAMSSGMLIIFCMGGAVVMVPSILQIIAGIKFIKHFRKNEA